MKNLTFTFAELPLRVQNDMIRERLERLMEQDDTLREMVQAQMDMHGIRHIATTKLLRYHHR